MDRDKEKRYMPLLMSGISLGLLGYFELRNWNENKELRELKRDLVRPIQLMKTNEGKPVYVSGMIQLSNTEEIEDDLFNIKQAGIMLRRTVELLQWKKVANEQYELR